MLKLTVFSLFLLCLCSGCTATTPQIAPTATQYTPLPNSLLTVTGTYPPPTIASSHFPEATTPIPTTGSVQSTLPPAIAPSATPPVNGWKTFSWTAQHLAVDYPADWSVTTFASGLTINSPQGQAIRVDRVAIPGISPTDFLAENDLPNTRCTSGKNNNGAMYHTCLDTISRTINSNMVINFASGEPAQLTLTEDLRGTSQVFDEVVNSVRIVP